MIKWTKNNITPFKKEVLGDLLLVKEAFSNEGRFRINHRLVFENGDYHLTEHSVEEGGGCLICARIRSQALS